MTAAPGAHTPLLKAEVSARAAAHLRALAREPRPTGSAAAASGRRYCTDVLTSLGFDVREQPFEYSALVGELGTPAGGVAMLLLMVTAALVSLGFRPIAGLAVLVLGGVLVMLAGRWAARQGVLHLAGRRRHGVNLEARRPHVTPGVWFVAHIDSKSQPISLVVRAAGIILLGIAFIAALALCVAGMVRGDVSREAWIAVLVAALVGAIPVVASVVTARSPGAIDNASGVATVLAAAELCASEPVGVLITDAEELGLAGARAWCAAVSGEQAPVINCDGIDDSGALTVMWTPPRAARIEEAVRRAASTVGEPLRSIPLIPGVLVDGLAFSDAGWEVLTVSRGSLDTLRHIHTPSDDLARLRGDGIAATAQVLALAAGFILERR